MATVRPSAQRIMSRCDILAGYSEHPGQICRRFLTEPFRDVHREVGRWMTDAGMKVHLDAAGNIIGCRPADSDDRGHILLLGSHLDTVPNAGKYDGILGVLSAIAVVEELTVDRLPFAIHVVGFSEEEGFRFSYPFIGSRAIAGTFEPSCLERTDEDGTSVREAIESFGLEPSEISAAAYDPEVVLGYLEVHLEQGPILQTKGLPIGIVTSIVGQSRLNLRFFGQAGHAGTTPMNMRQDALVGAAELIMFIHQVGSQVEDLRATVGHVEVSPNASNVIPDRVAMSLDVRSGSDRVRSQCVEEILAKANSIAANYRLRFDFEVRLDALAVKSDPTLVRVANEAATSCHCQPFAMTSGAGHDAMVLAEKFPTVMLFVRHPGAISHHPDEQVDSPDVEVAVQVAVEFVRRLAGSMSEGSLHTL